MGKSFISVLTFFVYHMLSCLFHVRVLKFYSSQLVIGPNFIAVSLVKEKKIHKTHSIFSSVQIMEHLDI